MGTAIVELKNVSKSFYGVNALQGMDMVIQKGEMHSLIGENGCGKSTMIKIISGFYTFDSGELWLNGKQIEKLTPLQAMNEGIQVIYQDFSLFPNLTVAENILMSQFVGSSQKLMDYRETVRRAEEQIRQLGVELDPYALVESLNVAQKQLVAICRALIRDAKLIIMDEPTTALTYKEVEALYAIVKGLLDKGIAVLFVSHKLDEVATISNRVTVMRNGRNVFDGFTKDLTREKMVEYMTGRKIVESRFEANVKDTDPILEARDISDHINFDHISFSLYRGEVLGITGLMGCGRSEIAEALFGLRPYEGSIFLHGKEVKIRDVKTAVSSGIAYVPEDRATEGLHMPRNIGENAVICVLKQCMGRLGMLDLKKVEKKRDEILSRVEIAGMQYEKEARQLSGGNQQKLLLVKWLGTDPDILILNCPTVGVDVGSKSEIHEIIRQIASRNLAVIVISDDIPEIMAVTNRILLIKNGEIDREIQTKDVTTEQMEKLLISK